MISALVDEPCVFIIDDAHNAASDAGALIDHIATQLVGEQRLLVLRGTSLRVQNAYGGLRTFISVPPI